MKCVDLEILLCDYVDETLSPAERATVDLHLEGCAACRELVADSRAAVEFMSTAADIEPPPALVNAILFEARAGSASPVKKQVKGGWISRVLEPILQPKFAMGMAMTILSFSMLARFAGIPIRQFKPSDLEPTRIWAGLEDKAYRSWDRAKKYYDSLRLVYEMQQTLKDWTVADEAQSSGQITSPKQDSGAKTPSEASKGDAVLEAPLDVKSQGETSDKRSDGRATK